MTWLERVQDVYQRNWEEIGIFDIIQLSRRGLKYNSSMLLASILFWEGSTNTFHFPCGMLTPTVFDVEAITGLSYLGRNYHLGEQPAPEFKFDNASFKQYILDHHDKEKT